ncbi:MAG: type II toxin-antitoxin system HicA family toxin [Methylococcales bacterium]
MSRHLNLLRSIFQDPVSANIHWREVESLLHHLGATIEPTHGARFRVVLNQLEIILHHPHHSNEFTKKDIKQLREYFSNAGISPSQYEIERNQINDELTP